MIESIGAVIANIFGVGVIGFLFFAYIIVLMKMINHDIVQWFFSRGNHVTISFKTFYKMYNIAPEKYIIDTSDFSVKYNGTWIYMKSLLDCFKLERYSNKIDKEKKTEQDNKKMLELLQQWQDDIDEFNKMKGYL